MELKKGQTIMMNVDLDMPAAILHKAVSNRSGMPLEGFALYYQSKQLEGEAALSSWGVEKDGTIEVKTRGRGGAKKGGSSRNVPQHGAEQARKDLKNLSVGQKVAQEVGVKGAGQAGKAIKGAQVLAAGADVLSGDAERQHGGTRELVGHGMAAAGHGYVNPVDIGDLTSNDPSRRGKAAAHVVGDVANHSAKLGMNVATNVVCRETGKHALATGVGGAVSAVGRRGAVVATGKGAAAAAAARGAAAGAGNIGKVAAGATGAAVGVAGIGGQIAGEALGGLIGKALGDEQTGKDVGGLSGSMGAAALAGACVGGPIGAAAGAGVAAVGFGVGKGVEAIAGVFGRCAKGGGWPNNARIVYAADWGHTWGRVEEKAKREVLSTPSTGSPSSRIGPSPATTSRSTRPTPASP